VIDVRTSRMSDRIAFVNDLVEANYDVHVNFSPVVIYDGWQEEYAQLFDEIDNVLSVAAKEQLAAEVIFLTHNEELHNVNLMWHPQAEMLLWQPEMQEAKVSESGGTNVRYRHGLKGNLLRTFTALLRKHLPYCTVRYAF
jgi:spore photoproduct lyase